MVLVFLNDTLGVLIGVERVHENERDIDLVSLIQVFDLSHGEVQESHPLADFDCRFGRAPPRLIGKKRQAGPV